LLVRTIYQAPFISEQYETGTSVGEIMGLKKSVPLYTQIILLDIFIFALLSYQSRIFQLEDFDLVNQIRVKHRFDAIELAVQRHKEYRAKIKENNLKSRKEQEARKIKLEKIRETRKEKHMYFGYSTILTQRSRFPLKDQEESVEKLTEETRVRKISRKKKAKRKELKKQRKKN